MNIFKIVVGDRKSNFRDPMSLFLTFIPLIMFCLVKFGLPIIAPIIIKWVDIYKYYDFILFMVYLISPLLLGFVLGLLLIDERDMDVLSYIAVTPFSLPGYLIIKSLIGIIVSILYNFILALMLKDIISFRLIFSFILTSTLVPYFAMAIVVFSKNKVEALTKGKLMSFTLIGAVIPYFVTTKLTYLMFFLPTFWIHNVFFSTNIHETMGNFVIGGIITLITVKLFLNRIIV